MLEARSVRKVFETGGGHRVAIGDVTIRVEQGEFVSVVGPSGCGKSTLLNLLAGFLSPTAGEVLVGSVPVRRGSVPPDLGFVFQQDSVLPWFTVRQNIALGPRYRGLPKDQIRATVVGLLKFAHLEDSGDLYPHQLSGGMRQRVALLMALACDPKVLLMDEPFGALDTHTKIELHQELLTIWDAQKQTILMVTHDLSEAISLSDRVLVLSSAPSRVVLNQPIKIPYPRDVFGIRGTAQFSAHFQTIWAVLAGEFRKTNVIAQ